MASLDLGIQGTKIGPDAAEKTAKAVDDPVKSEAETFLTGLMGKRVRLTITDGRKFVGELACVDNHSNIVLLDTYQMHPLHQELNTPIWIGKAIAPGKHVSKLEFDQTPSNDETKET